MSTYTRLKPDRALLDPNFEGYKLSLTPLPIYRRELNSAVCRAVQNETQFALQHYRIFGLHNHLYGDPWHEDWLYCVTDKRIINQVKFNQFGFDNPNIVLTLPEESYSVGDFNESIHFTSPHQVVIADGSGHLYLVMTDDRTTAAKWKIVFRCTVDDEVKPFVVLHSKLNCHLEVECLLLGSEDKRDTKSGDKASPHHSILIWVTLSSDKSGTWSISRKKRLTGIGPVEYASLHENGVAIVSPSRFRFTYDSSKPVKEKNEALVPLNGQLYMWIQSDADIKLVFKVPVKIKNYITVNMTSSTLSVKSEDGSLALTGELFAEIDVDNSSWNLENHILQITLRQLNSEIEWEKVVKDDDKGEKLTDPWQMDQLLELLISHERVERDVKPPFDPFELEECDAYPSGLFNLSIFDGESHEVICQVDLSGNQWLFGISLSPDHSPAFCVRHDVDGLVWQPSDNNTFEHKITLNAFGYVQASKQERKFSTCAPDGSFAVISDSSRHLYVYHRPSALASEVRNRRTGREISSVARQQVVNLDTTDDIIGIHATRQNIFVLTQQALFAIRIVNAPDV